MKPEEFTEFKEIYGEDFATPFNDALSTINEWRDWPWGRQANFWATDADKCPRTIYFTMWNVPKSNPEISDETTNIFAAGHKTEEHVVEKYHRLRGEVWTQARGAYELTDYVEDDGFEEAIAQAIIDYNFDVFRLFSPRITFKMDIVFDDLSSKFHEKVKRYVVEVKSIKDWAFKSHKRTGEKENYFIGIDMVTPEGYYQQLSQYMVFNGIADGLLHFVNKNTGAEFVWHIDHEHALNAVLNVVIPRFREAWVNYIHRQLPEQPYTIKLSKDGSRILKTGSDWHCRYCAYSSLCWELDDHNLEETLDEAYEAVTARKGLGCVRDGDDGEDETEEVLESKPTRKRRRPRRK